MMDTRILVVDDEPDISSLISDLLTDAGYIVQTAHDGREALEVITHDPPDLVITDVMMPNRDGRSLLEPLQHAGIMIPVLIVTVVPLNDGGVGAPVLSKPFDADALLDQVRHLLATPRR